MNLYRIALLLGLVALTCGRGAFAQLGSKVQELPQADYPILPSTPYAFGEGPADYSGRYVIKGKEGIISDEQNNVVYGKGRTRVEYEEFVIEADRLVADMTSGDIQAEGNVLFLGPTEFIRADRGRFNFITAQGVAYGVNGQSGDFYFKALWDEEKKGPSFRQIDEKTSIFEGSYFTTNPFPVPMYYIKGSEAIFIKGERVMMRNPVLYVRNIPVFWLPAYSRSLAEGSPWSQEFGYNSGLGGYFRLGYRYKHYTEVPDWEDPTQSVRRSHGLADFTADIYGRRGVGAGVTYRYQFDFNRHKGYLQLYGMTDNLRDPENLDRRFKDVNMDEKINELDGNTDEDYDGQRWVINWRHYSALRDDLSAQIDIDETSDPDIYSDVLDNFAPSTQFSRGRLFERYMRGALTYHKEGYIARIQAEQRERLGIDQYIDRSDPSSDDLIFDPDPIYTDDFEYHNDDGIPDRRFGTVRKNVSARYATRLLKMSSLPFYTRWEGNAFNSLDAGLNPLGTQDDTRVYGADVYGSITHRLRLGERTTWTNTLGAGAAYYEREDDRLIAEDDFFHVTTDSAGNPAFQEQLLSDGTYDPDFMAPVGTGITATEPPVDFPNTPIGEPGKLIVDSQRFEDENTAILGLSDHYVSTKDINNTYLFADYRSRLNHRFTDWLDGFIQYKLRRGTEDSLGEWYQSIGRTEAFEDVYNFYADEHFIEGGLNFYLRYPRITSGIIARQNLQTGDDIYPNEQRRFVGYGIGWRDIRDELGSTFIVNYEERQVRDRRDPNEFNQRSVGGSLRTAYLPKHARYWAALDLLWNYKLDKDPVERDIRVRRRFDEDKTEFVIAPTLGRKFGPKYRVQVSAAYNTKYSYFQNAGITILRDLHDAELGLFLGVVGTSEDERRDDSDIDEADLTDDKIDRVTEYSWDVRAQLKFKIGRDSPGLGQRSITTLSDLHRESQYVN